MYEKVSEVSSLIFDFYFGETEGKEGEINLKLIRIDPFFILLKNAG